MAGLGKNTLIKTFNITPSDTVAVKDDVANTYLHEAVFVVTLSTGNVSILTSDGATHAFLALPAGIVVGPILAKRINATGTTATVAGGIVGNS